ncbi:MAG: MBL fold metallo-hydrolase, partial [Anaerolineales bacterium]|nr:MBL fold metallo-hydrolase [Anaerolineales bacterium]
PKVIVLGSSNAIPQKDHDNTHLVVVGENCTMLIDCGSNPLIRLDQLNIGFEDVTDLVLTHFHPDHVSGVPLFLMNMWLLGRQRALNIYGLDYTIDRFEKMMELHSWSQWPNFFQVDLYRIPEQEMMPVFKGDEWKVFASPVRHIIPNIGLRIEFTKSEKVLSYSSDTEPCPELVLLAKGADILIHEAAGNSMGHSSASQAGKIASEADAKTLYLIHYPSGPHGTQGLVSEASKTFNGRVALAKDLMDLDF